MANSPVFQEKSYQKHAEHFQDYSKNGSKAEHAKTWLNNDTVDAWRHQRIMECLNPVLESFPHSSWVTIGDGRYGTEANFLKKRGMNALATDISDVLLKEGKEIGFIDNYSQENAEKLSFGDNQFEFAYCKEAYHHFPRPIIALYEMLRVAKVGVILTEPKDNHVYLNFFNIIFDKLRTNIKNLLGKKVSTHEFEEVGNYVYSISEREIEKVALGINLPCVAFKVVQDYYAVGSEYEKPVSESKLFQKVKFKIMIAEFLYRWKLQNSGLLTAIIFKVTPDQAVQDRLIADGFEIVMLPKNPYL
jgi:ubiquinone/menaquinone biosynthesis C-methylase UbiE